MLPVPVTGMPIEAKLLVQLNTSPPAVFALKGILIAAPGQTLTSVTAAGSGSGLTVMVNVRTAPVQPFKAALTLMVVMIGEPVAFKATKAGISKGAALSLPFTSPMAAPPLQLYVSPPAVFTPNAIKLWLAPAHTVWFAIAFTTGDALMVIVKVCVLGAVVVQPFLVALNTMVPTRSAPVTLVGAV